MNSQDVYSVTKLNRLVKRIIEVDVGTVWVSAEISNFVVAASGHWYFTLKDDKAQIRAAMFKGSNRRVAFKPKEGDKILVNGNVSLYEARGDYQLIVEKMEADGLGQLKQAFDQLKMKLLREGLFDQAHKQPLPKTIKRVGIITSSSGAALHDIVTVFGRRNPQTKLICYPAQVQGELAPAQLIQALRTVNRRNEVDLIIIGRGGGSLEDLWCFNDEALAREIFASTIPVISAVGHEIDVTICDFVADMRAPTPSAAAELASSDQSELIHLVSLKFQRMQKAWLNYLQNKQAIVRLQEQKLSGLDPQSQLQQNSQTLDYLQRNLTQQMSALLKHWENRCQNAQQRLERTSPALTLDAKKDAHKKLSAALTETMTALIKSKQRDWDQQRHLLDSVSPLSTLGRGYSYTTHDGNLVRSVNQVSAGQAIQTKVADGFITSTVQTVKSD